MGACGVMDLEGSPGILNLLLEVDRMTTISRALLAPIEPHITNPPLRVKLQKHGNRVVKIEIVKSSFVFLCCLFVPECVVIYSVSVIFVTCSC